MQQNKIMCTKANVARWKWIGVPSFLEPLPPCCPAPTEVGMSSQTRCCTESKNNFSNKRIELRGNYFLVPELSRLPSHRVSPVAPMGCEHCRSCSQGREKARSASEAPTVLLDESVQPRACWVSCKCMEDGIFFFPFPTFFFCLWLSHRARHDSPRDAWEGVNTHLPQAMLPVQWPANIHTAWFVCLLVILSGWQVPDSPSPAARELPKRQFRKQSTLY